MPIVEKLGFFYLKNGCFGRRLDGVGTWREDVEVGWLIIILWVGVGVGLAGCGGGVVADGGVVLLRAVDLIAVEFGEAVHFGAHVISPGGLQVKRHVGTCGRYTQLNHFIGLG